MKSLTCEMCGGNDLIKHEGVFVCQHCGCKYSTEEAKRMMIEGTVDVSGTVKVDNSTLIENSLTNARRALKKEDWEEVEKYYNMVEQHVPDNIEAVFFSSYGKAMLSLTDSEYFKREQKFSVLKKSISIINECYETTTEDKERVLRDISNAIKKMKTAKFVFNNQNGPLAVGGNIWSINLIDSIRQAFVTELLQIAKIHNEEFIQQLISENKPAVKGCYVATAVYGSYDCPQVWTLRRFRDYTLAETWYGRTFIRMYYAISPTLVKWFGNTEWFKNMWRRVLDCMVRSLNENGVEDTPYNDR